MRAQLPFQPRNAPLNGVSSGSMSNRLASERSLVLIIHFFLMPTRGLNRCPHMPSRAVR